MVAFPRETVWKGGRPPSEETHLGFLVETGDLFGFGTWKHRQLRIDGEDQGLVIDIAWLGVATAHKGAVDQDGNKLADRLFSYLEDVAREHPDSRDDMPLHLVCDERNEAGIRFWQRNGFGEIGKVEIPGLTYIRMLRA